MGCGTTRTNKKYMVYLTKQQPKKHRDCITQANGVRLSWEEYDRSARHHTLKNNQACSGERSLKD